MPVLIDGHNLIGQLSSVSLDDPDDEEMLVRLLRVYQARSGKAVTVIFDPGSGSALTERYRSGEVKVVFASPGSSADAMIVRRVQKSSNPQSILVVTADRTLAGRVQALGARVQDAREFGVALETRAGGFSEEPVAWKDRPPLPEEVNAWLNIFETREHDAD